ncbi:hypothetical protein QEG98_38325 [Myxococcus sp. MxC21-1]|uniref:hypothetical protein n=1 Tax=Myxococcus sp. MxC21-1 TaxID=3041439 RepID=UPI00292CEA99|nr:hypothetical protein [Myxococcus sp. MxC21-1]WNZ61657.1 hypothetical protein QEG98_38325 [Myxococcus sp. MxC21-1]
MRRAVVLATAWVLGCGRSPSFGEREPFIPRDTAEVLARVPAVGVDARARERAALRKALAGHAGQLDMALRLARLEIEASRVLGEPRYLGRAQAALRPWWDWPRRRRACGWYAPPSTTRGATFRRPWRTWTRW